MPSSTIKMRSHQRFFGFSGLRARPFEPRLPEPPPELEDERRLPSLAITRLSHHRRRIAAAPSKRTQPCDMRTEPMLNSDTGG